MKLLALDFDGVVSDSAPESFVVALRTYVALRNESKLAPTLAPFLSGPAPSLDSVLAFPLYPAFLERMPLGNRAEDFGVVLASLEFEHPLADQAAYDAFRSAQQPDWLEAYHHRFYQERDALAAMDPEGWAGLMAAYAPLLPILHRRRHDTLLAIATAKDGRAVSRLLAAYALTELFSANRVFDKETGVHKTAHLRALSERFEVPLASITFVDDKVNHLDRVSPLGVRCGLAAWGYNGEREARIARERGYLVLSLEDFEAQLFT